MLKVDKNTMLTLHRGLLSGIVAKWDGVDCHFIN